MAVTWTEDQKKVIDTRNHNILVSAAAGSGKTAVLSGRILSLITDPENPADIDELLVVTFTRAAADEMRERIRQALETAHRKNPEDRHLLRQLTLIHSASITTIDSFCMQVVRNYFQEVDLDPSFRVGEDGELRLLSQDVLEDVLEEAYETGDRDFLEFADCYAAGQNDRMLERLIRRLYDFAQSYPWPDRWLSRCMEDREEWMMGFLDSVRKSISSYKIYAGMALHICQEPDGPWMYAPAVQSDLDALEKMERTGGYQDLYEELNGYSPERLSAKKDSQVSDTKRETVKNLRDGWKKGLDSIRKKYFFQEEKEMKEIMQKSGWATAVLVRLTLRFMDVYRERKREKNLVDFSDLEHYAVEIFCRDDGTPTEAARACAEKYREIFIDEYQDSNLVQEILLTSICGEYRGAHNLFMVGDVKQSIYSFRLARPELFAEKYKRYGEGEEGCVRIDLKKNFRSREEVLKSVNFLFRQVMQPDLGAITYDDAAALYPGADYIQSDEKTAFGASLFQTELWLLEHQPDTEEEGRTARELEARLCADRIRELVGKFKVTDKETGKLRPARYSDMVVLLRAMDGWADVYQEVLEEQGIPCRTVLRSGYFSAYEISTLLNMLRIIDNPRQDIPLTAVLCSAMGGFCEQELAVIRGEFMDVDFHEACMRYRREGREEELRIRLEKFYQMLERYREMLPYTPIHKLIFAILDETGFEACVSAMPGGEVRRANLAMLADRAMIFENTSYRGLFHFIRYIDRMIRFQVDYGEADAGGDRPDAVEIVSIHKSKGLEYPVVFVAGLGKKFNEMDARSMTALHLDEGIGMDFIDPIRRVRTPTLKKRAIQRRMREEMLGEELRVLYVAMTRAKEKLILTGAVRSLKDRMIGWYNETGNPASAITYETRNAAVSWLDLIMPALLRNQCSEEIMREYDLWPPFGHELYRKSAGTEVYCVHTWDLVREAVAGETEKKGGIEELAHFLSHPGTLSPEAATIRDALRETYDHPYPWAESAALPVKLSVSELKRQQRKQDDGDSSVLYEEEPVVPLLPRFLKEEEKSAGNIRGDAYHRLMERLDFGLDPGTDAVEQTIRTYIRDGIYSEEDAALVRTEDVVFLLSSPLGRRMAKAQNRGEFYREQPFVLGVPAADGEWVLVQGIIDAFFYEGEEIVLVDYKTDRLYRERDYEDRYLIQLAYYQKALEQVTGKRVKEVYIYSFTLGRALSLTVAAGNAAAGISGAAPEVIRR